MKNTTAILMILAAMTVTPACRADHMLDQASQALSTGDTERAVEVYRQAVTEDPTAEGYNNLGVALERSGRFAEAAEAYGTSLLLPNASRQSKVNLYRARLRSIISIGLPYVAGVFGGLLTVLMLVWLARWLRRAWRACCFRMKLRGVRVANLTHRVLCHDGRDQPDGNAYPDSESISLQADLLLPAYRDIYPLHLDLEIVRPGGTTWRTLHETIERAEAQRATVSFQLDEIATLLICPGTWMARLTLRNTRKVLAVTTFTVVTRASLVADLKATNVRLLAVQGDQVHPENLIFPDVETLVPTAVIQPRSCHPSKFTDMRLRLDLVNVDKQDEVESQGFPLDLTTGEMEFCAVSRPVAGDEIARKVGQWEFRLSVEGRLLARMPFVITSYEQILASLKVGRFDIMRIPRAGKPSPVGKVAYTENLHALCPVVTITSKLPSPRAGFHATLGVCVDDQPVGGTEGTLVMDRSSVELMPGEFTPPHMPEGHDSMRVSFVLLVEGRNLGIHEVTLCSRPPRCADSQGRIVNAPSARDMDYGSEADRILQDATVCR